MTQAQRVVALLSTRYKDKVYACDTEVADIDVKTASPVGHGKLISFALYCGPDAHFGVGATAPGRARSGWISLDCDDREGIVEVFKPFMRRTTTSEGVAQLQL